MYFVGLPGFSDKMALSKHIGEIVLNIQKSTACLPDKFPCQECSTTAKPNPKPPSYIP